MGISRLYLLLLFFFVNEFIYITISDNEQSNQKYEVIMVY